MAERDPEELLALREVVELLGKAAFYWMYRPRPVRIDIPDDVYWEVRKWATPDDIRLFGNGPMPFMSITVVLLDAMPPGTMGVTYSDGTIHSYTFWEE